MDYIFSHTPVAVPHVDTPYRRIMTKLPVPESVPLLEAIERYEPRSVLGQPPVVWHKAEGFQVHDPYGNMWLDWSAGVLVANIGHGHPEVKAAVSKEVRDGVLFSYCFPTVNRTQLAQRLVELAPKGLDKAFILTTGSETTENAIKLARTYGQKNAGPERVIIVSFCRGFHGRTMGAEMAGGFPEAKKWIGELPPNFVQVPFPDGFRCSNTSFELFEQSLAEQGIEAKNVAGVMMETYQGGGASFAPVRYVQRLQQWCRAHDALLMLDEVQAGFGRTGKLFGFEHYGIIPDIVCLAKGISGSLPLSAVLGGREIMDLYDPGSMTSTHGGNSVCCAAALANLNVLIEEGLIERAAMTGEELMSGLQVIRDNFPDIIGAIHGKGLVAGVHIVNADDMEPDGARAFDIVRRCFEKGLLMFAPVGYGGGTVKICPPLMITSDAIQDGLAVLRQSIQESLTE